MHNARSQAENYVRLAAEIAMSRRRSSSSPTSAIVSRSTPTFGRDGKAYDQFPDRQSFRIYLEDLRDPRIRRAAGRGLDGSDGARSGGRNWPASPARSRSGLRPSPGR